MKLFLLASVFWIISCTAPSSHLTSDYISEIENETPIPEDLIPTPAPLDYVWKCDGDATCISYWCRRMKNPPELGCLEAENRLIWLN